MRSKVPPAWARAALAMFGVGWGANQFSPMLRVYREQNGLSEAALTAMFGMYALGLIPALLVAGPYSDRRGRRTVVRPVVLLSSAATLVLMAGGTRPELLYAGRFLAGVASGAAFSAGSAWVKELSAQAPAGAGARRAAVFLSAGFGGGPLVSGMAGQWLPLPRITPYLPHLLIMAVVTPLAWRLPDPAAERDPAPWRAPRAARRKRFLLGVAVWAPWVFGTATAAFATLTALAAPHTHGLGIAFTGAVTALTLGTGIAVQPMTRRLAARGGTARAAVVGLLLAALGFVVAAGAAATGRVAAVPAAAVLLGASYGMLLVTGLREVEILADEGELAAFVAIFYMLIYVGFGAPYLFTVSAGPFGYPWCLLSAGLVTLLTVLVTRPALREEPARAVAPAEETPPVRR